MNSMMLYNAYAEDAVYMRYFVYLVCVILIERRFFKHVSFESIRLNNNVFFTSFLGKIDAANMSFEGTIMYLFFRGPETDFWKNEKEFMAFLINYLYTKIIVVQQLNTAFDFDLSYMQLIEKMCVHYCNNTIENIFSMKRFSPPPSFEESQKKLPPTPVTPTPVPTPTPTPIPTPVKQYQVTGQSWTVTWTITDVPTRTTIITCIDNIMIAATEHLKTDFLTTVRAILRRIKSANLLTTPDREELLNLNDADLLCLAEKDSCFLGEEYHWDGSQRVVKSSIKTIAKLKLGLAKPWYTRRTFVSLVSLIMYALHTTRINPSEAFYALRAYRGVYSDVSKGADWDETLPHLTESAVNALLTAGKMLLERGWDPIVGPIKATTNEQDYDVVCFTDASGAGWGAVAVEEDGITRTYQQRWIHEVDFSNQAPRKSPAERFTARYSAHTEPHGIAVYLQRLLDRGFHGPATIAIVTDHSPIVFAQRKHNGFGGIGRGFELESLYRLTNTMLHEHNIAVVFFYIKGEFSPADSFSRHIKKKTQRMGR